MTRALCIMLFLAVSLFTSAAPAAQPKPAGPTADELAKIAQAAAQAKPQVKPAKPRKVLVFSVAYGYWHDAIPYGKAAFAALADSTGTFQAVISDDLDNFEPGNIDQFDAIIFNNTNQDIFWPAEKLDNLSPEQKAAALDREARLQKSLVQWLQSGRGLFVIHAGVASFRRWDEFGNIMAARFDNHPWGSGSTVGMKVEEPGHPLARAFKEPRFKIVDETYQVTSPPWSRDKVRVIVSIDTENTNMSVNGIHRKDGDFAMTWVKPYGQGRVFYNAWGHDHPLYWTPFVLQHWLDGIQFATGDLEAPMTPRH